jgi:hypothetical protein
MARRSFYSVGSAAESGVQDDAKRAATSGSGQIRVVRLRRNNWALGKWDDTLPGSPETAASPKARSHNFLPGRRHPAAEPQPPHLILRQIDFSQTKRRNVVSRRIREVPGAESDGRNLSRITAEPLLFTPYSACIYGSKIVPPFGWFPCRYG